MELNLGNDNAGQFFTPFSISMLSSKIIMENPWRAILNGNGKISLSEPSCGAGGMIIAAAITLKEKGVNYQTYLDVRANDLDITAVKMTYIQCSLLGIPGIIYQQNTLTQNPIDRTDMWITPFYALNNNMINLKTIDNMVA